MAEEEAVLPKQAESNSLIVPEANIHVLEETGPPKGTKKKSKKVDGVWK